MAPELALRTALDWGAEALRLQLQAVLPQVAVEVLAQCASTNSSLLERARVAGEPFRPCLLVAECQTQGRGRLGRGWVSAAGASLTFSMALPLAPHDWSGLSLAVGVALAEALDPPCASAPRIGLKWPNDLWLIEPRGGRKLGGILIETVGAGRGRVCVVGVGLNVMPLASSLAAGLALGHLQELEAGVGAPQVLARVAAPLLLALQTFEREGFAPLEARYAQRDTLRGHEVTTSLAQPASGMAEGVDEGGALVLRAGGERHRIVSGEVSVRRAMALDPAR